MKKIYLLLIFIITRQYANSQVVSSVSNGNWTNPATWNCTCVPVDGASVTINHSVTLNTSMLFNTGGISINNSGSLIQDAARDILINGGYFYNNGTANFRFFNLASGTGSNSGSFSLTASSNSVAMINNGSIYMDSMYVAGNFTNTPSGTINGNRIAFVAPTINNGRITVSLSINNSTLTNNNYHGGYAFTNDGLYLNNDSIVLTYSLWNKIKFNNNPGSLIRLTKNFHNYVPGNTASFTNNGNVIILDSFYNTDTIKGSNTGTFTVADSSSNSGRMIGTYKFCDQTPPGSAPYIDYNSGFVGGGITWCTINGIQENKLTGSFYVYPNPSSGQVTVQGLKEEKLTLVDVTGKTITIINLNSINQYSFEIHNLKPGIYFLKGVQLHKKLLILD
ncbi:MAG: T9SS type A sorting domain-containing protein [Sphingobacteriaceae bacterium]|nr:T9SS type A sorting domain-containing protein [Sphingobacteriaceae bacterium]